jgi:hypothetical protein
MLIYLLHGELLSNKTENNKAIVTKHLVVLLHIHEVAGPIKKLHYTLVIILSEIWGLEGLLY